MIWMQWDEIYRQVADLVSARPSTYFFRGHSDSSWQLLPGLGRPAAIAAAEEWGGLYRLETTLYGRFTGRAGVLLRRPSDSWSNLFDMQHHGLPTRLLDWSRSFSIALFFALEGATKEATVWVLDPFELNEHTYIVRGVPDPLELPAQYVPWFLIEAPDTKFSAIAITPPADSPRVLGQRGAFTLHSDLKTPLETLLPQCLNRITIPASCFQAARTFLELTGVSAFALFPDLDGLAREIRDECLTLSPSSGNDAKSSAGRPIFGIKE